MGHPDLIDTQIFMGAFFQSITANLPMSQRRDMGHPNFPGTIQFEWIAREGDDGEQCMAGAYSGIVSRWTDWVARVYADHGIGLGLAPAPSQDFRQPALFPTYDGGGGHSDDSCD